MLHTLHNKIQRVRDLITEYDKEDDRCRNPNPTFHDFVQKLKVILDDETKITRKDGTNFANLEFNRNENVLGSSSSSSQIDVGELMNNPHPKVIEALTNHVVLTEIFKYGSHRDLNNFRLINKQWKGIANSAIIQKKLWKLRINKKFSAYNNSDRNEALSKLNECIEASGGSFPLTGIDFSDVSDKFFLDSPDILRFYALIGQSIQGVKFSNFGPLTVNEFQDLLVNKMPNLDHITTGKIFFTNEEECHVEIVLPHLKTIRFIELNESNESEDPLFQVLPYYKNLLLAATNLKEILDSQVKHMEAVFDTGKMHCIQKFKFDMDLETCSALYTKFSHFEPKLTSLAITRDSSNAVSNGEDVVFYSSELAQSLKRILISSKDTLKHLECMPYIFPADFQLPKFPNVKNLTVFDVVVDDADADDLPLPHVLPSAGYACSEIFPNLHTISLYISLNKDETLEKYFASQVFPSVKTLELAGSLQLCGAFKFKKNFPNVSHIEIINSEGIHSRTADDIHFFSGGFYPQIPKLDNQIESLELQQCILAHSGRDFQFDAVVTGVPTHICKKLLARHNRYKTRGGGDENIMAVKETLGLVQTQNYLFRNSKGLRRLKISFNHKRNANFRIPKYKNSDSNSDLDLDFDLDFGSDLDCEAGSDNGDVEPWKAVISPVSFVYGFSLMQNLERVIIAYDHHLPNAPDIAQVLKPLAQFPYVMIVHEPTLTHC